MKRNPRKVRWTKARPQQFKKSDVAVRQYCADCGACISMAYHHEPDEIGLAASCIDKGAELVKPAKCIFVEEKPAWAELPSGVPTLIGFGR